MATLTRRQLKKILLDAGFVESQILKGPKSDPQEISEGFEISVIDWQGTIRIEWNFEISEDERRRRKYLRPVDEREPQLRAIVDELIRHFPRLRYARRYQYKEIDEISSTSQLDDFEDMGWIEHPAIELLVDQDTGVWPINLMFDTVIVQDSLLSDSDRAENKRRVFETLKWTCSLPRNETLAGEFNRWRSGKVMGELPQY